MIDSNDIAAAVKPVAAALERMGVAYYIGGSVASSAYGVARSTLDVDMISSLKLEHIPQLVAALKDKYYVSEELVRDAIRRKSAFNIIHLETALKIDIFITKDRLYDQAAAKRIRPDTISKDGDTSEFYLAAPEDVILAKLEWYKKGDQASFRQWTDMLGVLKVQKDNLDVVYMRSWAEQLNVADLLERLLNDVSDI